VLGTAQWAAARYAEYLDVLEQLTAMLGDTTVALGTAGGADAAATVGAAEADPHITSPTAEALLYHAALHVARQAAVSELMGEKVAARGNYSLAMELLDALASDTNTSPRERAVLNTLLVSLHEHSGGG
jgi:hypothetical protein